AGGGGGGDGGNGVGPALGFEGFGDVGDGIGGVRGGNAAGGFDGIGIGTVGPGRGRIERIIAGNNQDIGGVPETTGSGALLRVGAEDFYFEGIAGPIVAGIPGNGVSEGEIRFVDIGEGILDAGTGDEGRAGLYSDGFIETVVGNNADIRGDIVAPEVNSISLTNGSFINADITDIPIIATGVVPGDADFSPTREGGLFGTSFFFLEGGNDTLGALTNFEIDEIVTTGGGFLGARIENNDIDTIASSGGFGMLRFSFTTTNDGVIDSISGDGLGLRLGVVEVGEQLGSIAAIGDAELLDVTDFSDSVRLQDRGFEFDPYSGFEVGPVNDVRVAVGLPDDVNSRRRITNSGVMENVRAVGRIDLGSASAAVIRTNLETLTAGPGFVDTGTGFGGGDPESPTFPMAFDFGRNVNDIEAISTFGLQVTAGEVDSFDAERDILNTLVRTSGRIGTVTAGDRIFDDSFIRAEGPDGIIESVQAGEITGLVRANVSIGDITIDGDLGGPGGGAATPFVTVPTIRVVGGPIASLNVGGDILSGAYVRATQELGEQIG
ncbi:MAG: hypothetical protein AAGK78_08045, partial [Planctomycetota bacterium]